MIYYKAVCEKHNFESSLFRREVDAKRSAVRHIQNVSGNHYVKILEVYVADFEIRSEKSVS